MEIGLVSMLLTPSAEPSAMLALVALLIISILVLLVLRYYLPLRTTPAYLLVPVFLALWLPACMVLLVPIDLASSAMVDDVAARCIWLAKRPLLVSWRITYWLTFALTWFILPILAEYSDSGYRDPKAKVLDSLSANAQYYAFVFGAGVLGLAYVLISYGRFSETLKSTVMAIAYCWGLVLAIYLMGHGLVGIPRRLLRNARPASRLRRLQEQAPRVYERMEDAEADLEALEATLGELGRRSKTGSARDFADWIQELLDLTNLPEQANPRRAGLVRGSADLGTNLPTVITDKYMAGLTRRLLRLRHTRLRCVNEWDRLLKDVLGTQAILASAASGRLVLTTGSCHAGFCDRLTVLDPYTRHLLHFRIMPGIRMVVGSLLSAASACIVWSEVVKGIHPAASVVRYTVMKGQGQVGLAGQAIAVLWMICMCAASVSSIAEVRVWRGRALVRRNTAHESAFWYASQVARLSIPLSYNFLTMVAGASPDTVFYDFLGSPINQSPLGRWFDYLFPALVLVPVLAALFGLYGRLARLLDTVANMDVMEDEDGGATTEHNGYGSWREGRDLIERELNGSIRARRAEEAARIAAGTTGGGRAGPILTIPRVQRVAEGSCGSATPLAPSPSTRHPVNTSTRRMGASCSPRSDGAFDSIDNGDDEDRFLASFGHRVKNALDTFETPIWFQYMAKKPKWMSGDSSSAISGRGNAGVWRWFGGGSGSGNGRIRLLGSS